MPKKEIAQEAFKMLQNSQLVSASPPLWDGKTSQRIVEILAANRGNPTRANTQITNLLVRVPSKTALKVRER